MQVPLPRVSDLPVRERALFHASVGSDLVLRTGLAAAIVSAATPSGLLLDKRAERRRLEFYADLAADRDAEKVFRAPPKDVAVRATEGESHVDGAVVELLRWRSPYLTANPELRREYADQERNMVGRAQHWRHPSGPRKTLCVIHGFGASPAWFNTVFFSLKEFFTEGWDIVLITLPFHGGRRSEGAPGNGLELFAGGPSRLHEGILQAICDFRVVVDHLERQGVPRVGVTGLSLGGYITSLLAATEPRLDFAIPNAAVTSMPELIAGWFPANVAMGLLQRVKSIPQALIDAALRLHSPLSYPPVLAHDRLMVIAGLGDRLAPPEQSLLLWEHWDRPALEWFPGSHVLHWHRAEYLGAMRQLMG